MGYLLRLLLNETCVQKKFYSPFKMVTFGVQPPDGYQGAKMTKLRGGDKGPLGPQSADLGVVTIDTRHQESGTRAALLKWPFPTRHLVLGVCSHGC